MTLTMCDSRLAILSSLARGGHSGRSHDRHPFADLIPDTSVPVSIVRLRPRQMAKMQWRMHERSF
jgi:hypothetical protein